jgi:rhamnose utilization protein RhaD (predicted bifunctional aldolase and dehydrogenase)/NAD(P)-dependent dehydrogenase (short-subunit alcohol dehydrogenase family)
MRNLWDSREAARFEGPLGECVYGSRLLGRDPSLVLHGGGNTSLKLTGTDIHGDPVEVLHVKGSGWDLATIEAAGFAPLRQGPVARLAELAALSDTEMVNQLRCNLLDASAPTPSVEAILHAILPFAAVQHSHADAVVAVTNSSDGRSLVEELWGDSTVVVPYVMPGFDLARVASRCWAEQAGDDTTSMILMNHGVFTFGDTTEIAYRRMVEVITGAEDLLADRSSGTPPPAPPFGEVDGLELARLRKGWCACSGHPMVMSRHVDERVRRFVARSDLATVSQRGNATPDHVIRTKRVPQLGTDFEQYAEQYRSYFARNARSRPELQMLDPAPRVLLDPSLGMLTAGRRAVDASIAADIYHHTIDVIEAADGLGGFVALTEEDLFAVEYWELEQAKLRLGGALPPMAGEIALVTGAASGIGRACAEALLRRGSAVAGLDIDPAVEDAFSSPNWLGVRADATDPTDVAAALQTTAARYGGIDVVVAAAGVFGDGSPIGTLDLADWRRTMSVNLDGVATVLRATHPYLALAPRGGRVVIVGSKNVPAPGKGAAAYSASKAAVTQLGRVAALEWAEDGITVNTVHPDGVFDTGLWNDELVATRASAYGLTPEEYRRRNLLGREIASADVGELVAELCGTTYRVVTGAQLPVDGGSDRVI